MRRIRISSRRPWRMCRTSLSRKTSNDLFCEMRPQFMVSLLETYLPLHNSDIPHQGFASHGPCCGQGVFQDWQILLVRWGRLARKTAFRSNIIKEAGFLVSISYGQRWRISDFTWWKSTRFQVGQTSAPLICDCRARKVSHSNDHRRRYEEDLRRRLSMLIRIQAHVVDTCLAELNVGECTVIRVGGRRCPLRISKEEGSLSRNTGCAHVGGSRDHTVRGYQLLMRFVSWSELADFAIT